eukprot:g54132.t1
MKWRLFLNLLVCFGEESRTAMQRKVITHSPRHQKNRKAEATGQRKYLSTSRSMVAPGALDAVGEIHRKVGEQCPIHGSKFRGKVCDGLLEQNKEFAHYLYCPSCEQNWVKEYVPIKLDE